jgi:hypothetical protein
MAVARLPGRIRRLVCGVAWWTALGAAVAVASEPAYRDGRPMATLRMNAKEPANQPWFLFTNHVGIDARGEYTDSVWVYWSKDLNRWDPQHKAVVLDRRNCTWSQDCIGLPSVIQVKNRLAIVYDAPGDHSVSHVRRHIGLAWLDLPLAPPR